MFRGRIFFWILLSLVATAGFFFAYQKQLTSTLVSFAALFIALVFVYVVESQVKRFSKLHLSSTTGSVHNMVRLVEARTLQHQAQIKQIIEAIEKIGTSDGLAISNVDEEVGRAIVALQNKLASVKKIEEQRVWVAQGIASLGEIRKDNAELSDYSFQIINQLVKYLQASQGAIYRLTDDQTPALELLSTYAYGRRKHATEKVVLELGTGLVGQCALGRETILMTDVPKDYVRITSGLGEALPRCIVIVPLLFREQVFGVIEIASFQKFENYQLEFISKACESVALEFSGIRAHERTRKLLEQSREAELRQNLEEMKITQQQMLMKEDELSKQLLSTKRAMAMAEAEQKKNEAILEGCMDAVISFNQQGDVEYFNKAAEEVFGIPRIEMIGQPVENLFKVRIVEANEDYKIISATGNEVTLRTEINAVDGNGEIISLLLTATKVKIDGQYLFTLFAQKVSVDLF